jgi:mitochondrial import receptor subunit TOM40
MADPSTSEPGFSWVNSIFAPTSPVGSIYHRINDWRISLDLPNPGTTENLGREAKRESLSCKRSIKMLNALGRSTVTHLSNYLFDGARAELNKQLSINPTFQVSHTFSLGSQAGPLGSGGGGTYNFGALLATAKVYISFCYTLAIRNSTPRCIAQTFMQGSVDHEGSLNGRFNYGWSASDITKIQAQISPSPASPSIVQIEHDRHGRDYALSFKAYNPTPELTGIYGASYLQSVSPNFALGLECLLQRPLPNVQEAALGYLAKWTGAKKDWTATAQFQPSQGIVQSTYHQKLGERVEAAAELMLVPSLVPAERKALGTVGAKYDFRAATFRAQLDSRGRISALLEQRLTGNFAVLMGGEIDHWNVSNQTWPSLLTFSPPSV